MTVHKSVSLADCVFEKLENDILSGKYAYGELLTEVRLSEELQVSRTPVREAIRRLEQENILLVTGKGIVVQGITKEDIRDILEVRLRIGIAARYAAQRMDEQQKTALQEAVELQDFYVSRADSEHVQWQDHEFHELIYAGSGSITLQSTLVPLHRKAQKYRRASVENKQRAVQSVAEHHAICEAILAGNADEAEQRMVEHIRMAQKSILGQ